VGRGLSELRATNENRQGINPPHLNPLLTKRRRYFGPRGCLQMVVARKWIHRSTDQASFLDPGESGRNLPGGGVGGPGGPKNRVRKNWAQIDVDFHSFLSIVSFPPYFSCFFLVLSFFPIGLQQLFPVETNLYHQIGCIPNKPKCFILLQ